MPPSETVPYFQTGKGTTCHPLETSRGVRTENRNVKQQTAETGGGTHKTYRDVSSLQHDLREAANSAVLDPVLTTRAAHHRPDKNTSTKEKGNGPDTSIVKQLCCDMGRAGAGLRQYTGEGKMAKYIQN